MIKADRIIKNAKIFTAEKDLLAEPHEGFSHSMPTDVFISGKKVN